MCAMVMIDLEALSVASDAAIVAIGAVRFDPVSRSVWDQSHPSANGTFYRVVNAKSAQRGGGRIDAETVMWWLNQGDGARKALTGDDSQPIEVVLKEFSAWLRHTPCTGVWGNGSDYDNVVLASAYQRLGQTPPWSYRLNRCYRTLASLRVNSPMVREGTHHNALDDAISQARHLCEILGKLGTEQ